MFTVVGEESVVAKSHCCCCCCSVVMILRAGDDWTFSSASLGVTIKILSPSFVDSIFGSSLFATCTSTCRPVASTTLIVDVDVESSGCCCCLDVNNVNGSWCSCCCVVYCWSLCMGVDRVTTPPLLFTITSSVPWLSDIPLTLDLGVCWCCETCCWWFPMVVVVVVVSSSSSSLFVAALLRAMRPILASCANWS